MSRGANGAPALCACAALSIAAGLPCGLIFELSLLRSEDDRVDKAAQRFSGGGTALFVF
jgi:hypothetical protein